MNVLYLLGTCGHDAASIGRHLACALLATGLLLITIAGESHSVGAIPSPREGPPDSIAASTSPKVRRYADALIERYDANADGVLQANEWRPMQGSPAQIDGNDDEEITAAEIAWHVTAYAAGRSLAPAYNPVVQSPFARQFSTLRAPSGGPSAEQNTAVASPANDDKPFYVPERFLPQSLPDWFRTQDANGDGQLSLSEYAGAGEAEQTAEFERLDRNRDGLVTPAELLAEPADSSRSAGGKRQPMTREPAATEGTTSAQ